MNSRESLHVFISPVLSRSPASQTTTLDVLAQSHVSIRLSLLPKISLAHGSTYADPDALNAAKGDRERVGSGWAGLYVFLSDL